MKNYLVKYNYCEENNLKNVEQFIRDALNPVPYTTTGQLEFAQEQADKNSDTLARLIAVLVGDGTLDAEDLHKISGVATDDDKVELIEEE